MTDASTKALTAIDRLYLHVDQGLPEPDLSDLWEEVCAEMNAVELAEAERDALQDENVKISASNRIWEAVCKTHEQSIAAHADAIAKAVAEEREKWVKVVSDIQDAHDSMVWGEDYEQTQALSKIDNICTAALKGEV